MQEPWDKVTTYASPRQPVSSDLIKLATYHSWFMTRDIPQEELEAGYPQGVPRVGISGTHQVSLLLMRNS